MEAAVFLFFCLNRRGAERSEEGVEELVCAITIYLGYFYNEGSFYISRTLYIS
jgi:hypothetical protein